MTLSVEQEENLLKAYLKVLFTLYGDKMPDDKKMVLARCALAKTVFGVTYSKVIEDELDKVEEDYYTKQQRKTKK